MAEIHTPVLVVGGGVTGLSGALFLAWHGVPCLLVERHPDLLIHPRARGLTPRTMECYRQVGLEPAIRAVAFAGDEFAYVPVRAATLNAEEYVTAEEPGEDDGSGASPSGFGPIDQDKLEILVRDRARKLGAEIRFGTELTSFTQDDTGVTAVITDRAGGERQTVRADYLIAADGVGSPIREQLGIGVDGPGPLYETITAIVEADLRPALRGRRLSIAYLQQPRPFTILLAHDDAGYRWVFGTGYDPEHESPDDYTEARVAEMVRAAAGLPAVDVTLHPQIPGTDAKVLAFPIAARVARRYRQGRVFLAGDAAHAVPPTGGLGANTGIQDAHNLAWKLAAATGGRAGAGLLDTYEQERRPVGLLTMEQALARFGSRMAGGDGPEPVEYAAVALGYGYRSSAVLGADGDARPLPPTELTGGPGTRAPHVPISRDDKELSTLDLYGRGFVLLAGPEGDAWASAAAGLDVPVTTYRFGVELAPAEAAAAYGIGAGGALLVRPDGFVAWRSPQASADPAAQLDHVLRTVLAR
ncbi:MAG: monooxygenase [Streptosporangiales bacterium]|nr:monooxygenase [Streptosporangiales bacterium]